MDVLSSRILVRPSDLDRSRRSYRDVLGLAIYREFGPPGDPRAVYFLGPGLLGVGPRTKYSLIAQRGRWCEAECVVISSRPVVTASAPAGFEAAMTGSRCLLLGLVWRADGLELRCLFV